MAFALAYTLIGAVVVALSALWNGWVIRTRPRAGIPRWPLQARPAADVLTIAIWPLQAIFLLWDVWQFVRVWSSRWWMLRKLHATGLTDEDLVNQVRKR